MLREGLSATIIEAMTIESAADYNRLCWHSRRGMLELDLVLGPFVREHYPSLPDLDKAHYRLLLECEDQDLFSWFMGRVTPEDEALVDIVDKILATART